MPGQPALDIAYKIPHVNQIYIEELVFEVTGSPLLAQLKCSPQLTSRVVQFDDDILILLALAQCLWALLLQFLLLFTRHFIHFSIFEYVRPQINKSLFEYLIRSHLIDRFLVDI